MLKAVGLEYEESGRGEAILLSHGGHVADGFVPFMHAPELTSCYRLIRYRRRGYAGSEPISGVFNVEEQADDARALLAHIGVERAHVVGHSYGGAIAVKLAIEAPDLVHTISVLEPSILAPETVPVFSDALLPIFAAYSSGDIAGATDRFMAAASASMWRSAIQQTVPGGEEQAERDAQTSFESEIPALTTNLLDVDGAKKLSLPVQYIMGSESGELFEEAMKYFLSVVPHAERVVIPEMNHLMQMLNAGRIVTPVADFISRHPM